VKTLIVISTDDGETMYNALRLANAAVQKEDEGRVFMPGPEILKKEVSGCQVWRKDQVLAAEVAVRAAVPAREAAAAAVFARGPAASVSVRPAATRRPISREFPVLKSNVPNAGQ
jgi:uncharacterized protein involved in oxidation of intracellular sulfur